jgi:uncharacterized protein YggT (Ycf19 family)
MDIIIIPFLKVISTALSFFQICLIGYVILSLLEVFGVVNRYSRLTYGIHTFLFRLIEPPLGLIRRFVPRMGNFDFSPMLLYFFIAFLQEVIFRILVKFPS